MESRLKDLSFQGLSRQEKIIFLAGVFDGEGTFGMWKKGRNTKKLYFSMAVEAADVDLVARFHEVFGGTFYQLNRKLKEHHKHTFRWKVNGDRAFEVIETMIPYMCQRRQDKYYGIVQSIRNGSQSGQSHLSKSSKDEDVNVGRSNETSRENGERRDGIPR